MALEKVRNINPTRPELPSIQESDTKVIGSLFLKENLSFTDNVGFHRGPRIRRKGRKLLVFSLIATLIDASLMLGSSLLFIYFASVVLKTNSTELFLYLNLHVWTAWTLSFVVFQGLYLTLGRLYYGQSIGEWACDIELGTSELRNQRDYPWRVVKRTLLNFATGIVSLPLCSLFFGRDIAGIFSKAPLTSKV